MLGVGGAFVGARLQAQAPAALSAQAVIDRITAHLGIPWREKTNDGLTFGNPAVRVTGIAVTLMPTVDVLRKAVAARANFVVALGPTFYTANDAAGPRASDPVYLAKREWLVKEGLVVWRFDDHWAARQPGRASAALADAMGWSGRLQPGTRAIYRIPDTTLAVLAADVAARLQAKGGLRVVGRGDLAVRSVFVSAGGTDVTGADGVVANLPHADAVLTGEPREWEAVPYVRDTWTAGRPKGLVAVGRLVSETPHLRACAAWLASVIPDVPASAVVVDDPYWNPAS